tara:strand:- start:168 stop:1112 length:945 start_codon:yes stop_codon:yes gene_type:complete
MILSYHDTKNILKDFPNVKLSYIKNVYKKVHSANLYYIIPKGKKYFAWFRYYKTKEVCFFLEIDRNNSIKNIVIRNCCFKEELCRGQGTILYGTIFKNENKDFFSTEDILFYKNNNLRGVELQNKIDIIEDLFKNYIKQVGIGFNDIIIGLPIITNTRNEIDYYLQNLAYEIYCVQHRYLKKNPYYYNEKIVNINKIFLVRAGIIDDIYLLYTKNRKTNKLELYSSALIPDYKTSVFMNQLFRNIKENRNLDLLEESDDDEEFENVSQNKYINNKEYLMECIFNNKHKLWTPVKISNRTADLKDDILRIEKNNR